MDLNKLKGQIPDSVLAQLPNVVQKYNINTNLRLAHFIAQCSHESGGFKITHENLNYGPTGLMKTFKKYFPTQELANAYARQPEKIANRVYANRMGNGNEASGDGWKYRGKGYIQLTGKENYVALDGSINENITSDPELVATTYPLLSAGWFWNRANLNATADQGSSTAVVTAVTKKINGGINGLDERIHLFNKFYRALNS